ncbi:glycosyltransferase family 2 protein [Streptomyces sp. MA5143a]|uniref:glycosyltransferase family 2 protein n=1 Tax=Streptomyces sp. MA5143a TaxID=2083010 RepID=UPI000D1B1F4C|nr:glycosyltransferase family A protein [Streptomyces sp. MA5143a]SPF05735.1 Glycosyl transferase family 2 [Streptomyces sp. MA5143a]
MHKDTIGVVTVTRGRPRLLRRAMASVHAQDFDGLIEHVVVIDEQDPETVAAATAAPIRPGLRVTVHEEPRPPAERNEPPGDKRRVYPRLSRLFNTGARISSADWIAFLDDDNEYEPHHLRSLLECAREHGVQVAHSGRTMWYADGAPYLEEAWHTVDDPVEAARIHRVMCDKGVRVPGTNVLLDRADPRRPGDAFRTSSVIRAEDPVALVDQSVWLVRRELLLRLPIPETFTEAEHLANTAPDDKLLRTLQDNGVPIVSTGQPTVRYYLGGVSNRITRGRQAVAAE